MKKIFTLFAALLVSSVMFAQKTYTVYWEEGLSKANAVTTSDGIKVQITGNESKELSNGNDITMPSGDALKAIKVSNGAENTITMPEGEYAGKVTFYSYVNKTADDIAGARTSYWKEVNGVAYDETTAKIMTCPNNKPVETPDVNTYDLGGVSSFTFTNIGEQVVYVAVIETSEKGPDGPAVPDTPLYTAVGKSAKFPADWGEGWDPATCMFPGVDVNVEVYNGYIIIRNWMGVEGYDCCFIVPEGENLEDATPTESYTIINGEEQEPSSASGYYYVYTGRTDYSTAAQYLPYSYISSDKESMEGDALICQYIYGEGEYGKDPESVYYYYITWPPLADEPVVVPGEAESWSVANADGTRKAEYDVLGEAGKASVVTFETENVSGTHVSGPIAGYIDADLEGAETGQPVAGKLEANVDNSWSNLNTKALSSDGSVAPFYYVQGKGNPVNLDLVTIEEIKTDGEPTGRFRAYWEDSYYKYDGTAGIPANGTFVTLTPKTNGTLTAACWINKGSRDIYVVPASTAVALKLGSEVIVNGYINGQNWKNEAGEDLEEGNPRRGYPMYQENIGTKGEEGYDAFIVGAGNQAAWVYLTWNATANETYYIFNKNTQLGFSGFEFTPGGSSSIATVEVARPANNVIYNLAGQRVGADYKGIVIKNGKKFLMK